MDISIFLCNIGGGVHSSGSQIETVHTSTLADRNAGRSVAGISKDGPGAMVTPTGKEQQSSGFGIGSGKKQAFQNFLSSIMPSVQSGLDEEEENVRKQETGENDEVR